MSVQVMIEMPEEVFSVLRTNQQEFAREMKLSALMKWLEMGKISQSKAAFLAGLSREEFLMELYRFGISPFQITEAELEQEVARG